MQNYYSMGMAAEVHMHQLLAEAEHGRLIRGIRSRHHERAAKSSLRARFAAAFQRLAGRPVAATTGTPAVQGR